VGKECMGRDRLQLARPLGRGSRARPEENTRVLGGPHQRLPQGVVLPDRRTALYCASEGRSALAADTLQRVGYGNVAHLDGGIKTWKEGGRPVEEVGPGQ
jgi:rhodanese-related sulfurtransferase